MTLKNTEPQAVYLIGTYSLSASDGTKQTLGDVGANFIDGNEIKTLTYDVEALPDGNINVDVFIIYGESKGSLEREIRKTLQVQTVRVLDECDVKINEVTFNARNKDFYVNVENAGKVDCYVDMEIIDIVIAGEKKTFGMDNVVNLASGSKKDLLIKVQNIEKDDYADNQKVKVKVYYGQRENALVRVIEGSFDLIIKSIDYLSYLLIALIIILILLIVWKRRKKKK